MPGKNLTKLKKGECILRKSTMITIALVLLGGLFLVGSWSTVLALDTAPDLTPIEALGKAMFFDADLSANGTQSCAACHAAEVGYTGPDALINAAGAVYQGALPNHFGNRKPPASAYAGDSPVLFFDEVDGGWFGGMFWDGRATGAHLGDPLAEQAQGPFLNPLEQAIPNVQVLCVKVKQADYASLFEEVWGEGSSLREGRNGVYERIGRSVAAYERSAEVNPFTSKFDLFWDNAALAGKDITMTIAVWVAVAWAVAVWVQWDAQAAVRTAGLVTAISVLLTPSCRDWPCSMTGLAAPPAIHYSQDQLVIPCLPTSATTTSVSQRIQTTPSITCLQPGTLMGRTG
jgi:hypothetical protein